jgi:hypothetical protein
LDYRKPEDKDLLLLILVDIINMLGAEPSRGRRRGAKHWSDHKLWRLWWAAEELKEEKPGLSNRAAAAELRNLYPHQTAEALRQRLTEADKMVRQFASFRRLDN